MTRPPPGSPLFPSPPLSRPPEVERLEVPADRLVRRLGHHHAPRTRGLLHARPGSVVVTEATHKAIGGRSEEHTSELQSQSNIVCRPLLEKKKKINIDCNPSH